jgi:ankyrin repeat protein
LLKSGAKIGDHDQFGETVLTSASKRGDAKLVELLLESGANVQTGGGFLDRSPLEWAAEEGNTETVACLLKHGAGKNPKSLNAALFNAAVRGSTASVRLLLEHGANAIEPAGYGGYTPLMAAAHSDIMNVENVKLLLERGAKVTSKGATGETAMQLARRRGHTEIVELLKNASTND